MRASDTSVFKERTAHAQAGNITSRKVRCILPSNVRLRVATTEGDDPFVRQWSRPIAKGISPTSSCSYLTRAAARLMWVAKVVYVRSRGGFSSCLLEQHIGFHHLKVGGQHTECRYGAAELQQLVTFHVQPCLPKMSPFATLAFWMSVNRAFEGGLSEAPEPTSGQNTSSRNSLNLSG